MSTAKLGEVERQLGAIKGEARADRARAHVMELTRQVKLASIEAL